MKTNMLYVICNIYMLSHEVKHLLDYLSHGYY